MLKSSTACSTPDLLKSLLMSRHFGDKSLSKTDMIPYYTPFQTPPRTLDIVACQRGGVASKHVMGEGTQTFTSAHKGRVGH